MSRHPHEGMWMPAVDVVEGVHDLTVCAELPGMKPEDISIEVDEDSLTLSGERHFEERAGEGHWARVERHFGRFERSVPLPRTAMRDEIAATYSDGLLEIRVPKASQTQPRRIPIHNGDSAHETEEKAA